MDMAIIILDRTNCAICRKILKSTDEALGFPAMFPNEADPLHLFNDAAIHGACLLVHPLRPIIEKRLAEYREKTGPGNRYCRVCGREILNPDDYLGLGHLTDEATSPLKPYNYAHFHRSCVRVWPDAPNVLSLLEIMVESGAWRGRGFQLLIKDLKGLLAK